MALKFVAAPDPDGALEDQLRREFTLSASLDPDAAARALELLDTPSGAVLVREYRDARTLSSLVAEGPLAPALACALGIAICESLSAVHRAGVVHRDLKPSNILVDVAERRAWLTDFGIAARLVGGRCAPNPERIEGTFAYMAPEQTGRTQRAVVPASDLYSLGVVLFEMLTGELPFRASSTLGWFHAHLALAPPDLHALLPAVPLALSGVVAKLLAKDPDARYQSATGLAKDLARCEESLRGAGSLDGFAPGQDDVPERFHRPDAVVGRGEQLAVMQAAFARAADGGFAVLRLRGEAGAGKSSLVAALRQQAAAAGALFVAGRHDLALRNVPYAGLLGAVRSALRLALSEEPAALALWRSRIADALHPNAGALASVVPELATLLGAIEEPSALGPAEAEVRFQLALRALVAALGSPLRPLVLVLDDLHWADEATLRALSGVIARAPASTLLVTAERDDEALSEAPRELLWKEHADAVTTLDVGPLPREGLIALVGRVFPGEPGQGEALADVVRARTHGNAFAAVEFLAALADAGVARFDGDARRWRVDVSAAASSALPDTTVSLVARRLDALSADAQGVLAVAAAAGSQFDGARVAAVAERSIEEVDAVLEHAASEGLVVVVADRGVPAWRFAHDRVEEAAYAALPRERRAEVHARLAREMCPRAGETLDALDAPGVFALAHHYALGREALDERDTSAAVTVARRAATLARATGAWRAALAHLDLAAGLSAAQRSDLELQIERAECAYLGTDFDALDAAAHAAHALAATPTDRARIDEVLVRAYNHRGEHARAVEVALSALSALGYDFAPSPSPVHVISGLTLTRWRLRGRRPEDLDALPRLTDPAQAAALRLMMTVSASAFFVAPTLFPLLALKVVQVTLAHGRSPIAAFGYAAYGLLLAVHFGQLDLGFRFGELARRAAAADAASLQGQVEFLFNYFIRHWKAPLADCAADMAAAARRALELGGLEYWSYNLTGSAATELIRGATLDRLEPRVRRDVSALRELRQHKTVIFATAMQAVIADLRGDPDREAYLAEARRGLEGYRAAGDVNGVANLTMLEALRHAFVGRASEALAAAEEADAHVASIAGQVYLPALRFAHALALADALPSLPPHKRAAGHIKLRQIASAFEGWARSSPESYGRRSLLVLAELARAEGRTRDAAARYDAAIARCDAAATPGDAALIHRCAAEFHRAQGNHLVARALAAEAYERCVRWGARALAQALASRFELTEPTERGPRAFSVTTTSAPGAVDFESSLKAARAVSEEIELDRLLRKLVAVVIENAGARRGALLDLRGGALRVVAEGVAGGEVSLRERALDEDDSLPRKVIRYVAQSGETVLLHDASTSAEFGADPYLHGRGARSVLCVALSRQGVVTGAVYLEHDGAAGVFTAQRAEVVRVLAAQAAVSLENARLYADLATSLRRQIALTDANARFVPTEFLSSLGRRSIDEVALGDSVQREMTVLFSDMRGFTRHVEGMTPVENISFINEYLSAMEPAILGEGGFVDSYIGDAIMALFSVPATRAVAAAVAMHRGLAALNARRASAGKRAIQIGVGLNTGELTLGTIGGPQRIKCGVIGDCVNLAARIESLTKRYDAGVLIGERTRSLLAPGDFTLREVDRVRVVGRLAPVTLYEVLDADAAPTRDAKIAHLELWSEALARYREGDLEGARDRFRRCLDAVPDDGAAALRLKRCEKYLTGPRPEPWSEVEEMSEK